jgi:hypothetical protein
VLSDLQVRNETLSLRDPDVGPRHLHADRLYAHSRGGVPEIRPYLPDAARDLLTLPVPAVQDKYLVGVCWKSFAELVARETRLPLNDEAKRSLFVSISAPAGKRATVLIRRDGRAFSGPDVYGPYYAKISFGKILSDSRRRPRLFSYYEIGVKTSPTQQRPRLRRSGEHSGVAEASYARCAHRSGGVPLCHGTPEMMANLASGQKVGKRHVIYAWLLLWAA